jgi:hypothetical protein
MKLPGEKWAHEPRTIWDSYSLNTHSFTYITTEPTTIMLHIHIHLCKCGTIFCCVGSREALPTYKLPDPASSSKVSSNVSNTLIQTQPQRQGGMELPNIIRASIVARPPTPPQS